MRLLSFFVWTLSLAALRGQQEATTLAALSNKADSIVVATAIAATDPSPDFHRIEFRTEQSLKGTVSGTFAVLEPAGRCCGRALGTLAIGDRVLAFLSQRGGALHPLGGDRGVIQGSDALIAHVQSLLQSGTPDRKGALLATALTSADARVRADAALALAQLPTAPLDAASQAKVLAALDQELAAGTNRIPALVTASVRFVGDAAAPTLVRAYVHTAAEDHAMALGRGLLQLSATSVHQALAAEALPDAVAQQRACELASAKPDPISIPMLTRMLDAQPRVALAAAEALLATGVAPTTLAPRTDAAVLETAVQRRSKLPQLRAVAPGGLR
jgi:hypothetical protein